MNCKYKIKAALKLKAAFILYYLKSITISY